VIIYSRDLSKWPLGRRPELPKHRISSSSLPVHHLSISEPPPNRNHATLCYQGFAITAIALFHGLISTSNILHLLDKVVYRRTLSPSLFSIPAPHAGSYPGVLFNSNSNIGTFEKYPDLNGLLRNNISAQPAHSVSSKKNAKLHWPLQKVYSQPNRVATNHIHDVLIFYGDLSVHLANTEALHHQQLIW